MSVNIRVSTKKCDCQIVILHKALAWWDDVADPVYTVPVRWSSDLHA